MDLFNVPVDLSSQLGQKSALETLQVNLLENCASDTFNIEVNNKLDELIALYQIAIEEDLANL